MPGKIIFSLSLILTGLLAGYAVQILWGRRSAAVTVFLDLLRKRIQQSVLLAVVPVTVAGSLWIVDLGGDGLSVLPFLGILHFLSGGLAAIVAGRWLSLDRSGKGSLFCCGLFTNLGSLGGLVVFLLLGEAGYALMPFYKLFGEFIYYGIGFPVAKYYSPGNERVALSLTDLAKKIFKDVFVIAALLSMAIGIGMNLSGIPRPDGYSILNAFLIPLGAFLMLFAIGLRIRFTKTGIYKRECLTVLAIKFLVTPLVVLSAAVLLGVRSAPDLPVLSVAIILAAMPVAFTATIPPTLYGLDIDMVNSCWLVSTVGLLVLLPVLSVLIPFTF